MDQNNNQKYYKSNDLTLEGYLYDLKEKHESKRAEEELEEFINGYNKPNNQQATNNNEKLEEKKKKGERDVSCCNIF